MKRVKSLKFLLKRWCTIQSSLVVSGLSIDSRQIQPGDLFFAISGANFDGRDHIEEAIKRGAVAVLCDKAGSSISGLSTNVPVIPIRHLKKIIGFIAAQFFDRPSHNMRCVGVTGTNGKTSCTQWIAQALNDEHQICGVIGTLGVGFPSNLEYSGFTTPDAVTLQSTLSQLLTKGALAVSIEASSHALDQHRLASMEIEVAVFTQLSHDHLDYHGDFSSYAKTKKRLFDWPTLKSAVINIDDPIGLEWAKEYAKHYPVMTYSLKSDSPALIKPLSIKTHSNGFSLQLQTLWGETTLEVPFIGHFNISNVLAVLGVLGYFGFSLNYIVQRIQNLRPVLGRMEIFKESKKAMVVVDYAHTPDALKNTLIALSEHCHGRLWCVFGCGGNRDRSKRAKMAVVAEAGSDFVIVTQDNPRTESVTQILNDIILGFSSLNAVHVEHDRRTAIDYAIQSADMNDLVLIAGKGHESYQVIGAEKLPLSDREIVLDSLSNNQKQ